MTIGITGGYCSGKNKASEIFREKGYTVVDVDSVGHEALETKREEIVRFFGVDILSAGRVDRKKLGARVFKSVTDKKKLESIVHPWMVDRVKAMAGKQKDTVINAALLIEMGLHKICDFVLAVDVSVDAAVKRGMLRDRLSKEEAEGRIRAQIPLKEKMEFVDKIIDNNGSVENFIEKVVLVIETLG
jgi:dephospho-CoA kinase